MTVNDEEPRYQLVDSNGNKVGTVYVNASGELALQEGTNQNEGVLGSDGTWTVPAVNTDDAQFKNQPFRDVRDYGAVGDGATDDTTAIQSALDGGGIIHIPHSHEFRADGLQTVNEPVAIVGRGTLKRRDSDTATDYVLDVVGDESVVLGITIDGNRATTANTGRNEGLRTSGQTTVQYVTSKNIGGTTNNLEIAFQNEAAGTVYVGCRTENVRYAGFRSDETVTWVGCHAEGDYRGFQTNLQTADSEAVAIGGQAVATTNQGGSAPVTFETGGVTGKTGKLLGVHLSGSPDAVGAKMVEFEQQILDGVTMDFDTSPVYGYYVTDESNGTEMDVRISDSVLDGQLRVLPNGSVDLSNVFIDGRGHVDAISTEGVVKGGTVSLLQDSANFGVYASGSDASVDLGPVHMETEGTNAGELYRLDTTNLSPGDVQFGRVRTTNTTIIRGNSDDYYVVVDGVGLNDGDPSAGNGTWGGNGYEGAEVIDEVNAASYTYRGGAWV